MSYIVELFGNNVRKHRERANLTLEKLAELTNQSYQNISKIELGGGFVSAETLEKISKALDVNPSVLFSTENLPEKLAQKSDYEQLLIDLIKNLDEEKQESIYKIITTFLKEVSKP